jgi:hypothetical protein
MFGRTGMGGMVSSPLLPFTPEPTEASDGVEPLGNEPSDMVDCVRCGWPLRRSCVDELDRRKVRPRVRSLRNEGMMASGRWGEQATKRGAGDRGMRERRGAGQTRSDLFDSKPSKSKPPTGQDEVRAIGRMEAQRRECRVSTWRRAAEAGSSIAVEHPDKSSGQGWQRMGLETVPRNSLPPDARKIGFG